MIATRHIARRALPERTRTLLLAALVAVLTGLAFLSVLHADFVLLDDNLHVFDNPYLQPVSLPNVGHFWTHPYRSLYVPLSYTAYAGLAVLARLPEPHAVAGLGAMTLDAHLFHAANLLLHCANAVLVFLLLRRLVRHDGAAVVGALLFALHPAQTESVAWVSELRGLLSAFFSLWALLLFGKRYGLATVCFVLALLCKPSAACVPLLAWSIAHWAEGQPARLLTLRVGAWLMLSLALAVLTSRLQFLAQTVAVPFWQRPFVAGDALAFYLGKLVWPVHLGVDYGRTPFWVMLHRATLFRWLVPAAAALLVWRAGRRAPTLRAAGAIFVAALLPVLGLTPFVFQAYSTVADRYLYLAMLSPALAAAWGLSRLPPGRISLPAWAVSAVLLLILGLQSTAQAQYWRDTPALMRRALDVNPRSWMAYNNMGVFFIQENDLPAAIANFQASLRINPLNRAAAFNLGTVQERTGHLMEAVTQYKICLQISPDYTDARYCLAETYEHLEQTNAAIGEYRALLRVTPGEAKAHNFLGVDLEMQGKNDEALGHFQEAVRLQPGVPGYYRNLGQALGAAGRNAEATAELREAARLDPAGASKDVPGESTEHAP